MRPIGDRLVIATHNPGKLREIAELIEPLGIKCVSAKELDLPEPEEIGNNFVDNADLKAREAADLSGLPALSDDSGLCVDALHGDIVVKPLHGFAGGSVFRVTRDGANLSALMELFNATYREPHVLQTFLPEVAEGDKRIVLVDGEVAGAVNRVPGQGEIRSNLAVGGKAAKTELTAGEREICAALGPELKQRGLLFVGIDVIGGKWLTEINVTSPTGIVAIDKFNGTDTPGRIWDAIEARLEARRTA